MHNQLVTLVATCYFLLLAASVLAEEDGLFERLDTDQNGLLAQDEVGAEDQQLFERLLRTADNNKDGQLSREEFAAGTMPPPRPQRDTPVRVGDRPDRPQPGRLFQRLDRNGDGKVTREEVPERFLDRFDRIDADGNGKVGREEFQRGISPLANRFQRDGKGNKKADKSKSKANRKRRTSQGENRMWADPPGKLIKALDADGDGTLSAEEIIAASSALMKLDQNGDGRISRPEWMPTRGELAERKRPLDRAGGQIRLKLVMKLDADGDGKISRQEAPPRLKDRLESLDTDNDGLLDKEELKALRPAGGVGKKSRKQDKP